MYSQFSISGSYVVKCNYCGHEYETRSRSVGTGHQMAICEECRPFIKLERDRTYYGRVVKDLPMSKMPARRDLSDGEFMEKVGHLLNAMINEAGSCVKCGTDKERTEARYFLLDGGIDTWIHFTGLEVSLPLRRMINEAADGYYKEEAI